MKVLLRGFTRMIHDPTEHIAKILLCHSLGQ